MATPGRDNDDFKKLANTPRADRFAKEKESDGGGGEDNATKLNKETRKLIAPRY
jgi:hypothetical protein